MQSCFGDNFQSRFRTSPFPGFQLGNSSAIGRKFDLPASPLGGTQNTQSSSDPTHSGAEKVEWKSPSDLFSIDVSIVADWRLEPHSPLYFHLSLRPTIALSGSTLRRFIPPPNELFPASPFQRLEISSHVGLQIAEQQYCLHSHISPHSGTQGS